MLHLGLTGGIGSGKSAVAALFAEMGAVVLDADLLARELMMPGAEATTAIAAAFGEGVLAPDGSVDRKALAARVFGDDSARVRLEAILHPKILRLRRERLERIRKERGEGTVVVTEAALIFEAGTRGEFDKTILVTAPEDVRLARLAGAGWAREAALARMRAQWPDERKRTLADFVVDNSGKIEAARRQVREIWKALAGC